MENTVQTKIQTKVCVVGGGPGGAFLGLLLARAGIDVVLLEKANNFSRDFRGESLSPDARQLLDDNGMKSFIREHGYLESKRLNLFENDVSLMRFDFADFDYENRYVIEFPQPVLLKGITDKAKEYDNFTLMMGASFKKLLQEDGKVVGIVATDADRNDITINANLVVAADGRYSKMRKMAGLQADIRKVERDVIWLKLPRPKGWAEEVRIKLKSNRHLIILPTYPDHLRIGCNIPVGGYKTFRNKGIGNLQEFIIDLEPELTEVVRDNLTDWKDIALLDIFTARVPQWSIDGMTLLGDSAHTITPVMGQGIKHAIFDAKKLFEVVQECLAANPNAVILSKQLEGYQAERQAQTDFILRVQERQEKVFNFSSKVKTLMRRTLYRLMNSLHSIKRSVIQRIYFTGYASSASLSAGNTTNAGYEGK